MYLKSLEIQGFKSFPDKTVLTFEKDITAIVGPNGSGKSNISDAMRWVMGEQSAKSLRGAKMEDVIFSGTEIRKPLGFAEVSITIDNSDGRIAVDYADVTVTRRYYRSGESEFFINKRAVRLKEVHELLMDTGLGRDGYSIIGQGKIDEILSVKSDDRRDFFEEAAGISKFRFKREEAEKKLAATEENLIRIRDIITELETQVLPLRAQAEKAKQYLALRDSLKAGEVSLWLNTLDRSKEELDKASADFNTADNQLKSAKKQLEDMYAEKENISQLILEKESEIESCRQNLADCQRQSAEIFSQLSVLRERLDGNKQSIERIILQINEQSGRENDILSQISEKERLADKIDEEISAEQNNEKTLREEYNEILRKISEEQGKNVQAQRSEAEYLALIAEKKSAVSAAQSMLDELCIRKEQTEKNSAEYKASLEETNEKNKQLEDEIERVNESMSASANVKAGMQLKINVFSEKVKNIEKICAENESECRILSDRVKILTEMENEYEGFSKAVKKVMMEARRGYLKNIVGTVADIIEVPKEYSVAVETALGGALSDIVTKDEQDAKKAIQYLKSADAGRATFLPMSAVKGNLLNMEGVLDESGAVGIAALLCSFDDCYQGIVYSLLGRVLVAENIDAAVNIAKKYGYKFKIVTLDGQVVNAGGSMTGGSAARGIGILSRAGELKDKKAALEQGLKKLEQEKINLDEARRAETAQAAQIDALNVEIRLFEDKLLELNTQKNQHSTHIKSIQEYADGLSDELSRVSEKIRQISDDKKSLLIELEETEKQLEEVRKANDTALSYNDKLKSDADDITAKLTGINDVIANLNVEKASLLSAVKELRGLAESIKGQKNQRDREIEEFNEKNRILNDEIALKERIKAENAETIRNIDDKLEKFAEEKTALSQKNAGIEDNFRGKNEEIVLLERECARLDAKKNQLADEETQIAEKLWESYQLTPLTARPLRIENASPAKIAKDIAEIKGKIKALGDVNVGAIEEFKRVNERYEFMSAQRNDIEKSKSDLTKLIAEISQHMETVFAQQFALINQNFNETFREMFGGGKAELTLTDKSDILNCGIEISVMLPGKSLKVISLLSGGEKAFVAIALYFAILKVRPTPFCVLDEIEAALDDVNVDRFAAYMRRLCRQTQFIVITHRRGTMEHSDVLYGVTMQERGVSKLLSIDVADIEKELKFNPD